MNRKLLWAVFAIGLALVITPFALGLPGKAAAGERMLPDFRLFTVFFVVPGVLLILLAGYGLFGSTLRDRIVFHHHARPTHA